MLDATLITIITLSFAFAGVAVKFLLASKCDNVNVCWGGLAIHRDVAAELEEDKILGINHTAIS